MLTPAAECIVKNGATVQRRALALGGFLILLMRVEDTVLVTSHRKRSPRRKLISSCLRHMMDFGSPSCRWHPWKLLVDGCLCATSNAHGACLDILRTVRQICLSVLLSKTTYCGQYWSRKGGRQNRVTVQAMSAFDSASKSNAQP